MQRIDALSRVAVPALIAAFAAFVLLAIGCTGAQAAPNGQVTSISASPFGDNSPGTTVNAASDTGADAAPDTGAAFVADAALNAALNTAPAPVVEMTADATGQVLTSCTPGRDKVRVECNAVAPSPAQLQHSPSNNGTGLVRPVHAETAAELLPGRTPAALTHLDLGIVRT